MDFTPGESWLFWSRHHDNPWKLLGMRNMSARRLAMLQFSSFVVWFSAWTITFFLLKKRIKYIFLSNTSMQTTKSYTSNPHHHRVSWGSREQCCRICQRFNQRSPGTCAVAVLSSANEDPPYSCWVKSQLQVGRIRKKWWMALIMSKALTFWIGMSCIKTTYPCV